MLWLRRKIDLLRVSRGFTVHSPFAFYFITRVLRERARFYCFETEVRNRDERLLFRLVNYFRPQSVCIVGEKGAARALEVMQMARRGVMPVERPDEADFVYVLVGSEALPIHCRVLLAADTSKAARCALLRATERGMTFRIGRTLIAVTRQELPRQHFELLP